VEVVEHVLLAREHPGTVPALAVFAAATQIRQRDQAAPLGPEHDACGIERGARDVEAAIAGEHGRDRAGRTRVAVVDEEHRHDGAIA